MNCRAARERMLEADLAELNEEPGSELPLHLRECPDCSALAEDIQKEMEWLDLAVSPPARSEARVEGARRRHGRSSRRPVRQAVAAAVLAAAIGGMALSRPWDRTSDMAGTRPETAFVPPPSVVEDAGEHSAIEFSIADPDITVIWLYEEDSR